MTKDYAKPSLKFVSLRNDEAVADNCWHASANGTTGWWFYDSEGPGYVTFRMEGNCSGRYDSFSFIPGDDGSYENEASAIANLKTMLDRDGKQLFTDGGTFSPDKPGEEWS